MRSFLLAVTGAVGLLLTLSGCSGTGGCTEIGCGSQVHFRLEYDLQAGQAYEVEACTDDYCDTQTLEVSESRARVEGALPSVHVGALGVQTDEDIVYLALPDERNWSGTHRTTLTVEDESGARVVEIAQEADFDRVQPNGPDCPPVCWQAEVAE